MDIVRQKPVHILGVVSFMFAAAAAVAGTGGTEFNTLLALVTGWVDGALGRSLALIALLIGAGTGIVRGTIMPAAVGLAIAVTLAVAPTVINGILTAVI